MPPVPPDKRKTTGALQSTVNPLDVASPTPTPLVPMGAGKTPLGALEPILSLHKPLPSKTDRPADPATELLRVSLFAKEQLVCPVPYVKIEAKKITDNQYRVNWLAVDVGQNEKNPAVRASNLKQSNLIKTFLRVHSEMVRVVWGQQAVILTAMPAPKKA